MFNFNKTTMIVALAFAVPTVRAGELDELKALLAQQQAVMTQLQQRVTQLETQLSVAPQTPSKTPVLPVTAGDLPGSFKIPGTDTSLKIYGAARIDTTYDLRGRIVDTFNNDWAASVFAQPFDNSANGRRHGQFFSTARASRLGFMTSTPTQAGNLLVKVEGDFNAPNQYQAELGSNSTLFRLRHAYGQLGNVLVGQTWSNFTDLRSFPETVDFNPPGSATLLRQSQLRYTFPVGGSSLAFSIENPESLTWLPPAYDRAGN
ncbi:MAG: porin, partial [Sulfuricella sp.]|nr:porin [Sulfuricella sp.]